MLPKDIRDEMGQLPANACHALKRKIVDEWEEAGAELSSWKEFPVRLRHELSDLPYRIHGGREFDLMLKGIKPFSVFENPSAAMAKILDKYFVPMADERGWAIAKFSDDIQTFMCALPKEAWRINAYRLVQDISRRVKWDDTLELMEGLLLGYSQEQNEIWLEYRRNEGLQWGLQKMYKFVEDAEVASIAKTGFKAFLSENSSEELVLYFPHFGAEDQEKQRALFSVKKSPLAKFHLPMVKLNYRSRYVKNIDGLDFEIFECAKSELPALNREISGAIEIVSPPHEE